ncbi:MAG: peptidase [Alphaproteobacteria bacterium]|nr:peptidase [Alphaproteobacteria bacterium]
MTYCVGVMVDSGLVFAADRRTNAGADHVAEFKKMTVFEKKSDRVLVLLSAGNLAITQAVIETLEEHLDDHDDTPSLFTVPTMFRAARLVGNVLRELHDLDAEDLSEHNVEFNANFILGGQISGEEPKLYQIYAAGNFIEATPETPFLQIGETKYGKPVLDRLVRVSSDLAETAKCVLVSYSPTLRSNVSVGLPIDLVCYRKDRFEVSSRLVIAQNDPYFTSLSKRWDEGLAALFAELPNPAL